MARTHVEGMIPWDTWRARGEMSVLGWVLECLLPRVKGSGSMVFFGIV